MRKKNITVEIQPFFWLIAFLIAFMSTDNGSSFKERLPFILIWVGIVFISVLFHEFGHAITAVAFKQKAKIELVGMGGQTSREGPELKKWQEFLIVFNGPLFGLVLALIANVLYMKIGQNNPYLGYALYYTFVANIFWTIVNLFPILPLDGGKLISVFLESLFGISGIKIALFVSILLATLASISFFMIQSILGGVLFLILAFENYRSWQAIRQVTKEDKDVRLQDNFKSIQEDIQSNQTELAIEKLKDIRSKSGKGVLYRAATQQLATLLDQIQKKKEAYDLLSSINVHLDQESLQYLQKLAYDCGYWKEAIKWGTKIYKEEPNYQVAFINAACYARENDSKSAVGWLKGSIQLGLPNPRAMINASDFDLIRSTPSFQELIKLLQLR